MKPSMLYEALHALLAERVPLHIWGACGVGKSQIVSQVADDLDLDFLDIRAVQLDPVDLRRLPRIASDRTEWVPPKFLPTSGKGILFLDELTSAPQMTQVGCYQLVLDRKLGEYVLPDGWVVIAAGNPASERGVHFSMPQPLRNRLTLPKDVLLDNRFRGMSAERIYNLLDQDEQESQQKTGSSNRSDDPSKSGDDGESSQDGSEDGSSAPKHLAGSAKFSTHHHQRKPMARIRPNRHGIGRSRSNRRRVLRSWRGNFRRVSNAASRSRTSCGRLA